MNCLDCDYNYSKDIKFDEYNPEVIRYTILSKHYSTDSDLSDREFALSEKQMFYFYNIVRNRFCNIYIPSIGHISIFYINFRFGVF